jgi:hypothetical protein
VTVYFLESFTAVHIKKTETQKYLRNIKIHGRKEERLREEMIEGRKNNRRKIRKKKIEIMDGWKAERMDGINNGKEDGNK